MISLGPFTFKSYTEAKELIAQLFQSYHKNNASMKILSVDEHKKKHKTLKGEGLP